MSERREAPSNLILWLAMSMYFMASCYIHGRQNKRLDAICASIPTCEVSE